MSEVLTAAQMRAIEAAAIASGAVTGLELMERAGPGGTKKGVVRNPALQQAAVAAVSDWLQGAGWSVQATADSPITGGDGNVEFLLWASRR